MSALQRRFRPFLGPQLADLGGNSEMGPERLQLLGSLARIVEDRDSRRCARGGLPVGTTVRVRGAT